jgi:hypothetical protein
MKLPFALAIALLSGSITLAAQQGSAGGQAPFGFSRLQPDNSIQSGPQVLPVLPACPAFFTARHLPDGSMILTGRTHPKGIGQWLHISMMPMPGKPKVTGATLAVRGYSGKGRMTETDGIDGPDAVRTVTVVFVSAPNGQAEGDAWAPGLTAVASLDLMAVAYSDGSSWNVPGGHTCRITPDPLMLISGR